jgi:hypothetical protein
VKAITLTQPWATLVAIGAKRIETRSWRTDYRGPLAIHAAAGLGPVGGRRGLLRVTCEPHFQDALGPIYGRGVMNIDAMPRGVIVATCDLVSVVTTQLAKTPGGIGWAGPDGRIYDFTLTDQERAFGDYSNGRYAWLLADVRPLTEPIPAKGALGLWEWKSNA